MRVLFIHQNMPGQFAQLAMALAADPRNQVAFVTRRIDRELPDVLRVSYELRTPRSKANHPQGSAFVTQTLYGKAVVQSCRALLARGFKPDVIIGHPGWGELLFVKDVLPDVPLISYCEFYHAPDKPFFSGDPPTPLGPGERMRRRAESAHLLLSLEAADKGWSPTRWQRSVHPAAYQNKIEVVFDGVDTALLKPDPAAVFGLPDGRTLRTGDEVLTYAARTLEPTRGFPTFYRALPDLLARRPNLQVLIAGDETAHYDAPPEEAATWAERLRTAVRLDSQRVHFLGRLPFDRFVRMLQVSRLHVYLTTPTVLSWSMLQAMSVGCSILASDTPPVTEFIRDGDTGHLTPFNDPAALAEAAELLLEEGGDETARRARRLVEDRLSIRKCLPAQRAFVEGLGCR